MFEKFTRDIAIDFGTASVLVYVQDQGIVLKEPSVVAIDVSTDRVVKVGQDAMEMLGRTPDHIDALRPMKNGTISQYEVTLQMLRYFIRRACGKRPVSDEQIRTMIDHVVANIEGDEVGADKIAGLVMNELHKVDEVAYIRFASVYRQFTDVAQFLSAITEIVKK